jgi:peptide/nickel transport system permease protein
MLNYLLRRLGALVLVVIGVVTIVFFVVRAVPGDPVASILGEQALEVDKRALRTCLNLVETKSYCAEPGAQLSEAVERRFGAGAEVVTESTGCPGNPAGRSVEVSVPTSLLEQYRKYWASVLDGTFGHLCGERGATVWEKLRANIPATFQLALAAMAVAIFIAIPLGVVASLRPYSWLDNTSAVLALLGISIPNFWLGPMLLILFSLTLQALPNPGGEVTGLSALVLPAITLGTALAAKLTRMTRSSMLEVLNLDYVRTAKAKGAPRWRVVVKHALRNALIPVVTILGLQFGALLTGAIIVEKVFARPGLGTLLLEGIQGRNYRVVQGCVVFISMSYVVVNLLTDLVYAQLDPRIQYEERDFPFGTWLGLVAIWAALIGHPGWTAALAVVAAGYWLHRIKPALPLSGLVLLLFGYPIAFAIVELLTLVVFLALYFGPADGAPSDSPDASGG